MFQIDASSVELATVTVGEGGWVDLAAPIIVRPGGAFISVPELIE